METRRVHARGLEEGGETRVGVIAGVHRGLMGLAFPEGPKGQGAGEGAELSPEEEAGAGVGRRPIQGGGDRFWPGRGREGGSPGSSGAP